MPSNTDTSCFGPTCFAFHKEVWHSPPRQGGASCPRSSCRHFGAPRGLPRQGGNSWNREISVRWDMGLFQLVAAMNRSPDFWVQLICRQPVAAFSRDSEWSPSPSVMRRGKMSGTTTSDVAVDVVWSFSTRVTWQGESSFTFCRVRRHCGHSWNTLAFSCLCHPQAGS